MPEPAAKVPDASALASVCNINARPEVPNDWKNAMMRGASEKREQCQ
jgi:hypothetical protein